MLIDESMILRKSNNFYLLKRCLYICLRPHSVKNYQEQIYRVSKYMCRRPDIVSLTLIYCHIIWPICNRNFTEYGEKFRPNEEIKLILYKIYYIKND